MVEGLPSSTKGRIEIDLALQDPVWLDDLPDAQYDVKRAGTAALTRFCTGPPLGLAVVLASDAELRTLNLRWRGIDRPTNVLSFSSEERTPGSTPAPPAGAPDDLPIELGDVVLARETVMREAGEGGIPPSHHLCHLVVHGSLHLMGYDHEDDDEAACMEGLEAAVLAGLGIPNPYL